MCFKDRTIDVVLSFLRLLDRKVADGMRVVILKCQRYKYKSLHNTKIKGVIIND